MALGAAAFILETSFARWRFLSKGPVKKDILKSKKLNFTAQEGNDPAEVLLKV